MHKIRSRGTALLVAIVVATAALLAPGAPAAAAASGCTIKSGYYSCSTATLPANATTHQVLMVVFAGDGVTVTCRVHDAANGNEVGRLSNGNYWVAKDKVISGLYGRYFMVCVRSVTYGGGGGSLNN